MVKGAHLLCSATGFEPGSWARLLLLWERDEVEASHKGVALLRRVLQDYIVDHVLKDLAVAIELESGDAVEDAFGVPGHSGNAMHAPPHSVKRVELFGSGWCRSWLPTQEEEV